MIVNLLGCPKAHFHCLKRAPTTLQHGVILEYAKTLIFITHTNTHSVLKGKYRMNHDCEPPPLIHL